MRFLIVAVLSIATLPGCHNIPIATPIQRGAAPPSHRPNVTTPPTEVDREQPGPAKHTSRQTIKASTATEERWILRAYQARKNLEEWAKMPAQSPAERVRSQIEFAYMQHLPDSEHSDLVAQKVGDTEVRSLFLHESDEKPEESPFMISWFDSKAASGPETGCRIVRLPASWTLFAHSGNQLTVHAGEDELGRPLAIVTFQTDNPFATKVTEPDWVRLEEQWTQRALAGLSRIEALEKKGNSLSPSEKIEVHVETAYASHIPADEKSALYSVVVKRDDDWEFRKIVINAGDVGNESLLVLAWMYRDSQLVGFRTESVPPNWQVSQIQNRVAVSVVEGDQKPWTLLFDKDNPFEFKITE